MYCLQDPTDPNTPFLLEYLLEACERASYGAAAFAWATSNGLTLLLEDATFQNFLQQSRFDLIIGVDAVTTPATLTKLDELAHRHTNLKARVFLHSRRDAIFHPKTCWFAHSEGATLITGSGNLTLGGLTGHWEAFVREALSREGARQLESDWKAWRERNEALLRTPLDDEVIASAAANTGREIPNRPQPRTRVSTAGTGSIERQGDMPSVLVAEIPRSGDRWNQANFDLATYEGYFGARRGTKRRILLQSVRRDGTLGEIESRPSVEVISQNYRFELAAAAGIPYPTLGRPIGVFRRNDAGVFLYQLCLPGDPYYNELKDFLDRRGGTGSSYMRRFVLAATELRIPLPDLPIWTTEETLG